MLTSTRFLVWDYLESNGDLQAIAEIVVRRPFRLLIPVFAIAMLEYFFMDSGAINWLEYMPSVTWSTWAYTLGEFFSLFEWNRVMLERACFKLERNFIFLCSAAQYHGVLPLRL